jgi:hypothetical protein
LAITQQPLKIDKNKRKFGILRSLEFLNVSLTTFQNNPILPIKLVADFEPQPSYLLSDTSITATKH